MDTAIENLVKTKPNLSLNSIKTYTSILKNIYLKLTQQPISNFTLDIFKNTDDVLELLKDNSPSNIRTKIAAILVILEANNFEKKYNDAIKLYRDVMMEKNNLAKEIELKQERTDKQKSKFIDWSEILDIYERLEKKYLKRLSNPDEDPHELLPFIIASLYVLHPPRRLIDYSNMKFKNFDKKIDNYIEINKKGPSFFVFNNYKTSKVYGEQKIEIKTDLLKILKNFLKLIEDKNSDFLLLGINNVKLNGIINIIFGRRIGASGLRSSFLSKYYSQIPKLKEIQELSSDMAHSFDTALKSYVKK